MCQATPPVALGSLQCHLAVVLLLTLLLFILVCLVLIPGSHLLCVMLLYFTLFQPWLIIGTLWFSDFWLHDFLTMLFSLVWLFASLVSRFILMLASVLVSKLNSTFGLTKVVWWKYVPLKTSEIAVEETCIDSTGNRTDVEVPCMISLESAFS